MPTACPRPAGPAPAETAAPKVAAGLTVQFVTPDGQSVDAALASLRGTPHVTGAATSSIAIGGTSVMRVTYAGSAVELATALRERGWQVAIVGSVLRIHR